MKYLRRRGVIASIAAIFLTGIAAFILLGNTSGSPGVGHLRVERDGETIRSAQVRSDVAGLPDPSELPGYEEIAALKETFPHRVSAIRAEEGEWALLLDGTWYHWAEGRLLPADLKDKWEEFIPIRFYNYSLGPWTAPEISPELEERLVRSTRNRDSDERQRFNSFLDDLYQVNSRETADGHMRRVEFFGHSTRVHPEVITPLAGVERRIDHVMLENQEVRDFVRNLASIHGYNWRLIAGTQRRSYHSYGMAVDLVPRTYNGGWAYWRWAADGGVDSWWRLPGDDRWRIPQPIIDAFEAEGFVWGGKWLFFDNLHFEYRPEVVHMARNDR